ncbi:MAG: hypothetical protein HUK24_04805, partial [Sphaerochaetaceae bacterium]|nr:hypothetical protein [Sphaerochaetaceae bacterium]
MLLWEKHELEYGTKPQFCVNIPGNVVITGLFSAFCNSNIISANGSPALCVTVSEAQGSIVRIVNNRTNDHKHFSLSSSKFKKEDKWANYVKGIVSVLRESNYHVGALNFSIDGPYLNSDTLHLASAIAVGVVLAFDKAFSLNIPRYEMVKICV